MNKTAATQVCLGWNAHNNPPLEEDKVIKTVASIAATHRRNHPQEDAPDTPLFDLEAASVGRFIGKKPAPRDWVLQDCLPAGKVGLLVAPGGAGKSQLVLQLAYDIATGTQRYSPWAPGPAGQVVIIGAEDEDEEFHRRFDRLLQPSPLDPDLIDTIDLLKKNLFIVPRVGEDNLMTSNHGGEVTHTGLVDRLALAVAEADYLRLIVIDPVARFRGGEENAAEDTTRFVEEAERLAQSSGAAVLLVHHANKLSMQSGEQNQAAARGSSALSDGVRLQINLAPVGAKEMGGTAGVAASDRVMKLQITKTNCSTTGDTILLSRDDLGRLLRLDVRLGADAKEQEQDLLVAKLVRTEEAAGRTYSKHRFAARFGGCPGPFGVGRTSLKGIVDRAIIRGLVEISPGRDKVLVAKTTPAAPDQATVDG